MLSCCRFFIWLLPVIALASCSGCSGPDLAYPEKVRYEFAPHTILESTDKVKTYDLKEDKRDELTKLLLPTFGTPREPLVNVDDASQEIAILKLGKEQLASGSKLFRAQCLHCHGKEGNGLGTTSPLLNPKPRDYRQGKFKFVTTVRKDAQGKPDTALASYPARADLFHTIENGLPGSGMTPFKQDAQQIEDIVSYVIHLSLRGQVEYRLTRQWCDEDEKPQDKDVARELKDILKQWAADAQSVYQSQVTWEEIEREGTATKWAKGRDLFLYRAGCPDCHGKNGMAKLEEVPNIATMKDDWGHPIKPRNFTQDAYRGGEKPIDLFYRIRLGMKPSRMQAADQSKITDADVWNLVGYIKSLEIKANAQ
jgi:mono/diheme cytochrome c family protein